MAAPTTTLARFRVGRVPAPLRFVAASLDGHIVMVSVLFASWIQSGLSAGTTPLGSKPFSCTLFVLALLGAVPLVEESFGSSVPRSPSDSPERAAGHGRLHAAVCFSRLCCLSCCYSVSLRQMLIPLKGVLFWEFFISPVALQVLALYVSSVCLILGLSFPLTPTIFCAVSLDNTF